METLDIKTLEKLTDDDLMYVLKVVIALAVRASRSAS